MREQGGVNGVPSSSAQAERLPDDSPWLPQGSQCGSRRPHEDPNCACDRCAAFDAASASISIPGRTKEEIRRDERALWSVVRHGDTAFAIKHESMGEIGVRDSGTFEVLYFKTRECAEKVIDDLLDEYDRSPPPHFSIGGA